jgi:leucyl-tRNA synthetase
MGFIKSNEPFKNLLTQGMVLKDGTKMSKSKGNTVDPQGLMDSYGADTVRLFTMFAAPPEQSLEWSDTGVEGAFRFIKKLWKMVVEHMSMVEGITALCPNQSGVRVGAEPRANEVYERVHEAGDDGEGNTTEKLSGKGILNEPQKALRRQLHETIAKITDDMDRRHTFNTAIASAMAFLNTLGQYAGEAPQDILLKQEAYTAIVSMLSPIIPHVTQALWEQLGQPGLVMDAPWPVCDESALTRTTVTLVIQVNGKVRARIEVAADLPKSELEQLVEQDTRVLPYLTNQRIQKIIIVPNKLVNIVCSEQ